MKVAVAIITILGIFAYYCRSWTDSSPAMAVATLAYLMMTVGFLVRRTKIALHPIFMLAAMFVDILLVIFLQFNKDVIQTAATEPLGLLPRIHILSSLAAVSLYIPMMVLGFRLQSGRFRDGQLHMKIGILTYSLRTIGFLTMFSLLKEASRTATS